MFRQVQLLHCIRQSNDGGETTFSDGFAVATKLREYFPETFDILTKTKTHFWNYANDAGKALHVDAKNPITVNEKGELVKIAFSTYVNDSHRHLNAEQQQRFTRAAHQFLSLVESKEFCIKFKIKEGEIVFFDNQRVMHGREQYEVTEPRFLEGGYLDWDQLRGMVRYLKRDIFEKKLDEIDF